MLTRTMSFSPLRPDIPVPPRTASPLYAILVPHSNASAVDYDMAAPYVQVPAFPKDWTPNHDPFERPDVARILQWVVDLIQLAHTCRHAFRHMETKRLVVHLQNATGCVMHNDVLNPLSRVLGSGAAGWTWYRAMGGPTRYTDPSATHIPWRRLSCVITAALLDRPAVAAWWKPADVEMNLDALCNLSPLYGHGMGDPAVDYDFSSHPLIMPKLPLVINPVVRDKLHGRALQNRIWLTLALELKARAIQPRIVRLAGQYDVVWSKVGEWSATGYRWIPLEWIAPARFAALHYGPCATLKERRQKTAEVVERWAYHVPTEEEHLPDDESSSA
jgi:hypothetical protein